VTNIHDPDWVSQPDTQDTLEYRLAGTEDEKVIEQFIEVLNKQSEFDRALILAYVQRAAHMGKLKLP